MVYGVFPGTFDFTTTESASAAVDAVNAALNGENAEKVGAESRQVGEIDTLYRIVFDSAQENDLLSATSWEASNVTGDWIKSAQEDIDCYSLCQRVHATFTVAGGSNANPLWPDADDLGSGWWNTWMGVLYDGSFPWIYHETLDFLWVDGTAPSSVWLYSEVLDWMWTADGEYPLLWSSAGDGWYWYDETSADPVWFYNFAAEAWESYDLTP